MGKFQKPSKQPWNAMDTDAVRGAAQRQCYTRDRKCGIENVKIVTEIAHLMAKPWPMLEIRWSPFRPAAPVTSVIHATQNRPKNSTHSLRLIVMTGDDRMRLHFGSNRQRSKAHADRAPISFMSRIMHLGHGFSLSFSCSANNKPAAAEFPIYF